MKLVSLIILLLLSTITLFSQCGITGMQAQMLQDSSFPIQNTSSTSLSVKIVDGNYPTTLGVEDNNAVPGNIKAFSSGETGAIVTDASTQFGTYLVRISNSSLNCVDTLEVEVVTILPVEWLKPLTVKPINNSNEVHFATAQETNNSHFEIQKSIDSKVFQTIGRIEGAGSTSIENYYTFFDDNPINGVNYFRVKQVDFDGQFGYSNIASVRFESTENKIFPNPTTSKISITTNQEQEVRIYNQLGKLVQSATILKGENLIDISELSEGVYYLRVGSETEILIKE